MRGLLFAVAISGLFTFTSEAQSFQERFNTLLQDAQGKIIGTPSQTNNYQLELTMHRAGKSARYQIAFNGGKVSTDLLDRLSDQNTNSEPKTISFSVTFTPFGDGGGEASVFVGRNITFKTKTQGQEGKPDREVVQQRNMGLNTKVALRPGKPVVIFDDEDEKITLKLTEL